MSTRDLVGFNREEKKGNRNALQNSLYRVPGVKQVDILQTIPLKGQRRWYGHFMIPLLISTVVFSLGVLTVLLDVVMDLL